MTQPQPLARLYLRASTAGQDATRAQPAVERWAGERGIRIAGTYPETASGTTLDRPELWRLLADSQRGDILLVEQVDRLSRLAPEDWERLRREIADRGVRIVALDLPTSIDPAAHAGNHLFELVNGLLLDLLAAMARKDWEDRRRRQHEGQERAKAAGKYRGRQMDTATRNKVADALGKGMSWADAAEEAECSRATVARVAAEIKRATSQ